VVVESGRAYFDTNTNEHYHIFHQDTGELCDIPDHTLSTLALPDPPVGTEVDRIDVIVRVRHKT
jgi:Fur family iron response transcriptional regulator